MSMVFCPGNEMTSTDIAMLRNVLATWCRETGNEADSPQAATKSAELMVWFQFGIRRPHQLLEMIRPL